MLQLLFGLQLVFFYLLLLLFYFFFKFQWSITSISFHLTVVLTHKKQNVPVKTAATIECCLVTHALLQVTTKNVCEKKTNFNCVHYSVCLLFFFFFILLPKIKYFFFKSLQKHRIRYFCSHREELKNFMENYGKQFFFFLCSRC